MRSLCSVKAVVEDRVKWVKTKIPGPVGEWQAKRCMERGNGKLVTDRCREIHPPLL